MVALHISLGSMRLAFNFSTFNVSRPCFLDITSAPSIGEHFFFIVLYCSILLFLFLLFLLSFAFDMAVVAVVVVFLIIRILTIYSNFQYVC